MLVEKEFKEKSSVLGCSGTAALFSETGLSLGPSDGAAQTETGLGLNSGWTFTLSGSAL